MEEFDGVASAPDWTPWGRPRRAERGVETAFHHRLVMVRAVGGARVEIVTPGEVALDATGQAIEWSPMPWASWGRRRWRSLKALGPEAVIRGAGERLFACTDATCEQEFEGAGLGARGLQRWVETLERRIAFCEARGFVYRHLVVPDAVGVYPDLISGAPRLSTDRPLLQILRAGGERLRGHFVYPLEAMIAGRARAETLLPHDIHFTGWGCFLCYRELVATLPVDPARVVREEELRVRQVFIAGDVARSVGAPGRSVETHEPPAAPRRALVKGASFRPMQVDVLQSDATDLPRLVMFRTSNSTHLFPYLLRHFSRLVAVADTNVHYDLIESERPDVVICEMPERYFAGLQTNPSETDGGAPLEDSLDAFERLTGHKLPLPREP